MLNDLDICSRCLQQVDERRPVGAGVMLFHRVCLPTCRFCDRPYDVGEAGWDFRGGTEWSDEWGYIPTLESASCPSCTDEGERRDYGSGW